MNENKPYMDLDSDDDLPDLATPEWQTKFAQVPVQRGRPKAAVTKISTTIRPAPHVLTAFKADCPVGRLESIKLCEKVSDWSKPCSTASNSLLPIEQHPERLVHVIVKQVKGFCRLKKRKAVRGHASGLNDSCLQ